MSAPGFPRFKQGGTPKPRPKGLRRVSTKRQAQIDELAAVRPVLIERSRGRCEAQVSTLCTGIGNHAHHMIRRSQGGKNDAANLLWVCHFCHDRIHSNPAEALVHGFIRPPGGAA